MISSNIILESVSCLSASKDQHHYLSYWWRTFISRTHCHIGHY